MSRATEVVAAAIFTHRHADRRPRNRAKLACETRDDTRHCFDHHGYTSTEERSGDHVRGWDGAGHAWTKWRLGDQTYRWPSR
jgi:hypothetical protein